MLLAILALLAARAAAFQSTFDFRHDLLNLTFTASRQGSVSVVQRAGVVAIHSASTTGAAAPDVFVPLLQVTRISAVRRVLVGVQTPAVLESGYSSSIGVAVFSEQGLRAADPLGGPSIISSVRTLAGGVVYSSLHNSSVGSSTSASPSPPESFVAIDRPSPLGMQGWFLFGPSLGAAGGQPLHTSREGEIGRPLSSSMMWSPVGPLAPPFAPDEPVVVGLIARSSYR